MLTNSLQHSENSIEMKTTELKAGVPGTPKWSDIIWNAQDIPQSNAAEVHRLPPPYVKNAASSPQADSPDSIYSHSKDPRITSVELRANLPFAHRGGVTRAEELSTYSHEDLVREAVKQFQAFESAVKKVEQLQRNIRTLETEHQPDRRRRRSLVITITVLFSLTVVGWSLAGHWKMERDQTRVVLAKFEEDKLESALGGVHCAPAQQTSDLLESLGLPSSYTATGPATVSSNTSIVPLQTPGPELEAGKLDDGQKQGLPPWCVDLGHGNVVCDKSPAAHA